VLFAKAVTNDKGDTKRLVFALGNGHFAVYKIFSHALPRTVKIWKVAESSLATTMSFWGTKVPYRPTAEEINSAATAIHDMTKGAAHFAAMFVPWTAADAAGEGDGSWNDRPALGADK